MSSGISPVELVPNHILPYMKPQLSRSLWAASYATVSLEALFGCEADCFPSIQFAVHS